MSERDHGKEGGGGLMVTFQIKNKNTSSGYLDEAEVSTPLNLEI